MTKSDRGEEAIKTCVQLCVCVCVCVCVAEEWKNSSSY